MKLLTDEMVLAAIKLLNEAEVPEIRFFWMKDGKLAMGETMTGSWLGGKPVGAS